MRFFALNSSAGLGSRVADRLGCPISLHEERDFSGGEHKARPLTSVWGDDVYVLSSLHADRDFSVNDKICRLLFFIGALKTAGALQVTALMPYLAYSRKDRRTKPQDPVTTRYLAAALQSVGVDRVVTMDVHNLTALENSFDCPAVNLTTYDLFADYFYRASGDAIDTFLAPDLGGIKSTRLFMEAYARLSARPAGLAVMDKKRSEGEVTGAGLIGSIGDYVVILDDMIGSGTTLCRATAACLSAGARQVAVGATHGLFEGGSPKLFAASGIGSITVTDSVAVENLTLAEEQRERLEILGTADLLANCIRSMRT